MEFLLRINIEVPVPDAERNKYVGEVVRVFAEKLEAEPFSARESVVVHRKRRNESGGEGQTIFVAEGMYSEVPRAKQAIITDLNHPSPEHFGQTRNGNGRKRGK